MNNFVREKLSTKGTPSPYKARPAASATVPTKTIYSAKTTDVYRS